MAIDRNASWFHATSLQAAGSIASEGFRVWLQDEDEDEDWGRMYYPSSGNLGNGIYISRNWRVALWFGRVLLRVALRKGTRILDAIVPPDPKALEYLRREFGKELFRKPPWEVIPRNKKLTRTELINLFRYHYRMTWEREYQGSTVEWPQRREAHATMLHHFRRLLVRYDFHGFGDLHDENGVVIFSGDRLVLQEVIAEVAEAGLGNSFPQFESLEEVRDRLKSNSKEVRALAKLVSEGQKATRPAKGGESR